MIVLPALLALAGPGSAVVPVPHARPISDRQLVAYARRRYDRARMMFHHVVIGTQRGVAVVADFPCSDVCPAQTRRIIHLDVAAEAGACAAAGGVVRGRLMPMGIAVRQQPFCVPRVFAAGEPQPR